MTPSPSKLHGRVASRLHSALASALPMPWEVYEGLDVAVREHVAIRRPDLFVTTESVMLAEGDPVDSRDIALVIEITPPGNAENDRENKHWGYAVGQIPHYLLIDPFYPEGPRMLLSSEPEHGTYRKEEVFAFGDVITVPDPLNVKIDTSLLPLPPR